MSTESQSPKEGLLKRLLKAFKSVPPEALMEEPPHESHAHNSNKKETEDHKASNDVDQLWDMMASAPEKAREFIPDVFSKQALEIPEVKNLVLEILVNAYDSDLYSNERWLNNRMADITRIRGEYAASLKPKDSGILGEMENAISQKKLQIQDVNRRLDENKREIEKVKRGDPTDTKKDLQDAVDSIISSTNGNVDGEVKRVAQELRDYINKEEQGQAEMDGRGNSRGYFLEDRYLNLRKNLKEDYKKLNQTDPGYKEQRQKLRKKEGEIEELEKKIARYWGNLTGKLDKSQYRDVGGYEMHKDLLRRDQNYRDFYFYKTLQPILYNDRLEAHRDLTSLELIQRMEDFMYGISQAKDTGPNPDENYGRKLVAYYTRLKNMIFQSNDTDYYAAHPAQGIDEFIQSTAFFTNGYLDFGFSNPLVVLAKRSYESVLLEIRENHNGYIPRRYLEWNASSRDIPIDRMVRQRVLQAIKNGQVYNHPIDPATGEDQVDVYQRLRNSKGGVLGEKEKFTMDHLTGGLAPGSPGWTGELGNLRIASAMKQAKALGLVDLRFLEILAKSKGSGSNMNIKNQNDLTSFNMTGLASVPYEAVVQYLEPVIYKYSRFKIGDRKFNAFFNFMIQEKQSFGYKEIQEIIQMHEASDQAGLEKKYGKKLATRLISQDNPFLFSSMWGTMTGWRASMATTGWDDWRKERLSTANRLTGAGDRYILQLGSGHGGGEHGGHFDFDEDEKDLHDHGSRRNKRGYAYEKVKEYFLYEFAGMKKYVQDKRKNYRNGLLTGEDVRLREIAKNPVEFEKYWRQIGIKEFESEIKEKSKEERRKNFHGSVVELIMQTERAYKARVWAQAVMRSPLIVAREWGKENTGSTDPGREREGAIRKKILEDILHFKLPEVGLTQEPTKQQQEQLNRITDLEGALAGLSEKARRENRDLTDKDFDDIVDRDGDKSGDPSSTRELALRYWHAVQTAVLGTEGDHAGQMWYDALGIQSADLPDDQELRDYLLKPENGFLKPDNTIDLSDERLEGLRSHRIDFEKISDHINVHANEKDYADIFHGHAPHEFDNALLTGRMIDKDWRYFFSTEDMGWEYLNMVALGERNPVRRAGDLASHVQFSQGLDKLIAPAGGALGYHLNEEEFHKALTEMWGAISGDDADIAYDTVQRIFYNSMLMYRKMIPSYQKVPFVGWGAAKIKGFMRPMSVMQILGGPQGHLHADAFGPQDILKQIHMGEAAGYILPTAENPLTGKVDHWTEWNAHSLEARLGAGKDAVMFEAGNEVFWIILILLLWQAMKQSSADNAEGGGGGGGGGHH